MNLHKDKWQYRRENATARQRLTVRVFFRRQRDI
jgi:hypothetical protein